MDLGAIEPNELVRRARCGCADSFTELSRRFRPRLLNLLRDRMGGRHSDAEDVVQEALARAFQRLDQFDPRYRFSTWLYTITIRLASDHLRRQRRQPRQVASDRLDDICAASCPISPTQRQEDVDNLWRSARRALPDAQFTAMWLRYGEELPTDEVAQVMRRSRIGVRVLLHRARKALVAELARHDPSSPASLVLWTEDHGNVPRDR
jgi:RNA polymerase sigma-70 factor (ECF subfamily)